MRGAKDNHLAAPGRIPTVRVMRRIGILLAFVAIVFLVGALVAPLVLWSVQAGAASWPALRALADNPFPRFVSRTLMIVALAGLWPLHRALSRPPGRELGLNFGGNWRKAVGLGFVLGFVSIGLLVLGEIVFGVRSWRGVGLDAHMANVIVLSVLGAALTAPLEEIIFRGVLFGCLRSPAHWLAPLIISSGIFALLHFLQTPKPLSEVRWSSGFEVLGAMFAGGAVENRLPQFTNLFLCGVLLTWAYQRTGSLAFSIGLHGGWVLWLKLANALTVVTTASAFWGTRKVVDGWAATLVLLAVAALLPMLTRFHEHKTIHVPNTSSETPVVG
jgi:membrane protease YdiL (CAAX protease family)